MKEQPEAPMLALVIANGPEHIVTAWKIDPEQNLAFRAEPQFPEPWRVYKDQPEYIGYPGILDPVAGERAIDTLEAIQAIQGWSAREIGARIEAQKRAVELWRAGRRKPMPDTRRRIFELAALLFLPKPPSTEW